MPTYELVLLLKKMEINSLKQVLKRNAEYILESGGIIRKLESIGLKEMPYTIMSDKKRNKECYYFFMDFDTSASTIPDLHDKFKRDMDVLRARTFLQARGVTSLLKEEKKHECTLHLDLLPPPYRPGVIELQNKIERRKMNSRTKKFQFNTGLDFNPL